MIELEPNSIVRVTGTINISAGKTLRTVGSPDLSTYAKMARFVRVDGFNAEMLNVSGGARLERVWVDGGRGTAVSSDDMRRSATNITLASGANNVVDRVRADNTAGGTTIFAAGRNGGTPCVSNKLTYNLVTGYSSRYQRINGLAAWADGFTVFCESADVKGNQIVDVTDAAIVLFSGYPGGTPRPQNTAQRSLVNGNTVVYAGNSGYWGIGFEPFRGFDPSYPYPRMFDGARIESNVLKTSDMVHVATAFNAGTQSLWSDFVSGSCNTPSPTPGEDRQPSISPLPCYISNNTFVGRSAIAIGLHGMDGVQIYGNNVNLTGVPMPSLISSTFSCTESTISQPVVCAPGSSICPAGAIVAIRFNSCY